MGEDYARTLIPTGSMLPEQRKDQYSPIERGRSRERLYIFPRRATSFHIFCGQPLAYRAIWLLSLEKNYNRSLLLFVARGFSRLLLAPSFPHRQQEGAKQVPPCCQRMRVPISASWPNRLRIQRPALLLVTLVLVGAARHSRRLLALVDFQERYRANTRTRNLPRTSSTMSSNSRSVSWSFACVPVQH